MAKKRKYTKRSDYWKKFNKTSPSKKATTIHEGVSSFPRRVRTSNIYNNYNQDAKDIITDYDRATLANKARFFIENNGLVRSSIEEIATYSVGQSFAPVFGGEDKEWGELATEWLNKWMQSADLYGNDFQTVLWMTSVALDRDGDLGCVLTAANNGSYPLINLVPCHNIASKEDEVTSGPYTGYKIHDGVIYTQANLPIAYNVIGSTSGSQTVEYTLSKKNMMLVAEPRYVNQVRGYSSLASSLNSLIDYRDIVDFEKEAIKQASSIALIEKNEQGGANIEDELWGNTGSFSNGVTGETQPIYWKYYDSGGGIVRYFGSNDPGAGIEQIENNRPGADTAKFLKDHVLRTIYNSLNWPLELSYDMTGMGSAAARATLAKVERKLKRRQATLTKMWKRVVTYVVAKAIKSGFLPSNDEWYKWSPTYPAKPSIDLGKDTKSDLDLLRVGGTTLSAILGKNGEQFKQTISQRIAENKYIIDECAKAGIPVEMVTMSNPNQQIGAVEQEQTDTQDEEEQPQENQENTQEEQE